VERKSKVKSLAEAFAVLKDGMTLSMTTTHYNSVPMASMRQIVRQGPDAGECWDQVCPRVGECELDGLRRGRRLAPA